MESLSYLVTVCVVAVGLDWALYNGTYRSLQAFFRIPDGINYRHFVFPRIILILLSGVVVAISTQGDEPNVPIALAGFAIFLATSIYPQVRTFMKAERYLGDHDS